MPARTSAKTSAGVWTSDLRKRFIDKTNARVETSAGAGSSEENGTRLETGASAKTSIGSSGGASVETSASARTSEETGNDAGTSDDRGDVTTCIKCYTTKTVVFLMKKKNMQKLSRKHLL